MGLVGSAVVLVGVGGCGFGGFSVVVTIVGVATFSARKLGDENNVPVGLVSVVVVADVDATDDAFARLVITHGMFVLDCSASGIVGGV